MAVLGSYVTVPSTSEPAAEILRWGFTISAWIQPFNHSQGYILARSSADGTTLYYSLLLVATATSTTLEMTTTSASSLVSNLYLLRIDTHFCIKFNGVGIVLFPVYDIIIYSLEVKCSGTMQNNFEI